MSQHDFSVADGAGAVVRADLNAALEAIITNSSGATEPATPYANMWWYDTSTALLKRRNNANDAWIVLGLEAADTDGTLAANSDSLVATQKATKTYVDAKTIAENRLSLSDNTTANASTSAHGLLKKLSNVATEFMNGVGNWVSVTIDALLPSQTGNSGKILTTNGSVASWGDGAGVAAGTTILASASTERTETSTTYALIKRIDIGRGGSLTISFDMLSANFGDQPTYARIYKNGSPFGTEQSTLSTSYVTKTEALTFSAGDVLTLYGKAPSAGRNLNIRNLYIKGDFTTVTD